MAKQIIIKGTPVVAANEVLVADSNSKIPAVDASAVTAMAGGNITGTIPTARLDSGTAANKIVVLDGTGKLPAVDGSLLTGIVSHTTSASDPTITTNPSGGVGSEWINSTSGKQFICTDATTNENVWKCSGGGSDDILPWFFGGTQYGYRAAGHTPDVNTIDKYSFTSDGNATDAGDLSVGRAYPTEPGNSSTSHGYTSGGSPSSNVIDKFPYDTGANATDVGDLTSNRSSSFGATSTTHGYSAHNAIIDKFPFASDSNATDVGALSTTGANTGAGQSSETYGYASGAEPYSGPHGNVIDKYSFASAGTATLVGVLTRARGNCAGSSSTTHGYTHGGDGGGYWNEIDKFSFSTDGNATDVGDLTESKGYLSGSHY